MIDKHAMAENLPVAPVATENNAPDDKKERAARKVYIVVGQVHEFDSPGKAEKFLNTEGAPAEYAVIKGVKIGVNRKVSLR